MELWRWQTWRSAFEVESVGLRATSRTDVVWAAEYVRGHRAGGPVGHEVASRTRHRCSGGRWVQLGPAASLGASVIPLAGVGGPVGKDLGR